MTCVSLLVTIPTNLFKYDKKQLLINAQGLAGTIHESGHAIYEQSLNEQYFGLNVAQSLGMGMAFYVFSDIM